LLLVAVHPFIDTGNTANWAVIMRPVPSGRSVYISGAHECQQLRRTGMGKLVISTNVSLDGVVQDPDGQEGFKNGGWFSHFGGKDLDAWAKLAFEESLGADALLLGRRSEEWFATRWASRTGEWADRLNTLPKYVVSSTLTEPKWSNSTILSGEIVGEISKLKHELDREIVIYASYQLGRSLIEHDLVDEIRLVVFPVVLGAGLRLFGETCDMKPMRIIGTQRVGESLVFASYEFVPNGS
jgi:dihydrofolate reductase